MIKSFATKWKDYILGEAIEQETNISFEMIGKDYISVKGRKITAKLKFSGSDFPRRTDLPSIISSSFWY